MSKSFAINNKMREKLLHDLTVRAIEGAALRLQKQLEEIQARYWDMHTDAVEKLTGLNQKKWPKLIGHGVFAATSIVEPKVPNEEGKFKAAMGCELSEKTRGVLADSRIGLAGHDKFLSKSPWSRIQHGLRLRAGKSLPRLHQMEEVTDPELQILIEKASGNLQAMLDEGARFATQASRVLQSCRTSRQLADIFPEAAKLLPQPTKSTSEMVPQEQADQVREMLKSGIPSGATA